MSTTTALVLSCSIPSMSETCPITSSMPGSPSAYVGSFRPRQYNDSKDAPRRTHRIFPGLGGTPATHRPAHSAVSPSLSFSRGPFPPPQFHHTLSNHVVCNGLDTASTASPPTRSCHLPRRAPSRHGHAFSHVFWARQVSTLVCKELEERCATW